jgi:ankyrin repeat protein
MLATLRCVLADDAFELDGLLRAGEDPNGVAALEAPPPALAFAPSLLAVAAFHGSFQAFKLLMRRGASPRATDARRTPLECFIAAGGSLRILKAFLRACALQPPPPKNALHFAAEHGRAGVARFLLERGYCGPNCADPDGMTPLHYAVDGAHADVVECLLATGGVDPNRADRHGVLLPFSGPSCTRSRKAPPTPSSSRSSSRAPRST